MEPDSRIRLTRIQTRTPTRKYAVQSRHKNLMVLGLLAFGIFMRVLPYALLRMGVVDMTLLSTY